MMSQCIAVKDLHDVLHIQLCFQIGLVWVQSGSFKHTGLGESNFGRFTTAGLDGCFEKL